jgi:hypothetical protein
LNKVKIDGCLHLVPADWNELTRAQLLRLVPQLYGAFLDANEQRIQLLSILIGLPVLTLLGFTDVHLVQLLWLVDYLLEGVGLTQQLLPWVQLPWRQDWRRRRWWGPLQSLRNLTFLEFVYADSYFVAYCQTKDEAWLHKLLAVLYRPQRRRYRPHAADYGGDRRQDFNQYLVAGRAAKLAHLPAAEQLAILTWYRGCREQLEGRFHRVFTPSREEQAKTDGWAHVLREISGGPFGTLEETSRQHLHTVLAKMEDDTRRAQELERQARENQPA